MAKQSRPRQTMFVSVSGSPLARMAVNGDPPPVGEAAAVSTYSVRQPAQSRSRVIDTQARGPTGPRAPQCGAGSSARIVRAERVRGEAEASQHGGEGDVS